MVQPRLHKQIGPDNNPSDGGGYTEDGGTEHTVTLVEPIGNGEDEGKEGQQSTETEDHSNKMELAGESSDEPKDDTVPDLPPEEAVDNVEELTPLTMEPEEVSSKEEPAVVTSGEEANGSEQPEG
ncbi:hypothetical protein GDO81_023143 [Engystomops pustulosus]|uniref:Uncharacterized protein n=1 Tax=Engystomops pustulosus TaxID=76066 RepID=A0AAV6Z3A7_ENGPU|nr:hypothetical protein GDO81_023143 [Engystomops pustulosus]